MWPNLKLKKASHLKSVLFLFHNGVKFILNFNLKNLKIIWYQGYVLFFGSYNWHWADKCPVTISCDPIWNWKKISSYVQTNSWVFLFKTCYKIAIALINTQQHCCVIKSEILGPPAIGRVSWLRQALIVYPTYCEERTQIHWDFSFLYPVWC